MISALPNANNDEINPETNEDTICQYKDKKVRKTRSEAVPLGRLGTARDIGEAVMFLDSEQGSYVNGHELVVDGGVVHSLLNQLPRD